MAEKTGNKKEPSKFVVDKTRPYKKYFIGTVTKGDKRLTNDVVDYLDERGIVHILITETTLDKKGVKVSEKQTVKVHKGKIKTQLVNNRQTFFVTGGGPTPWHLQH